MSKLVDAFVSAFKKASTPKEPDALEHARSDGVLGPTTGDAAGSFTPLRPAPGVPPGGSAAPGLDVTRNPIGDVGPIVRPPSEPSPPTEPGEQGPIDGGGGGGTPTPPSAPFEPVTVRFREAGGTSDFKVEGVAVVEDPDAGGEVSEAGKANLDPGFIRRLRTIGDDRPPIEGGDQPQFTESSVDQPHRRPLTVVEEGGGSPGDGEPRLVPGSPGSPEPVGEPEQAVRLDRGGGTPTGGGEPTGSGFASGRPEGWTGEQPGFTSGRPEGGTGEQPGYTSGRPEGWTGEQTGTTAGRPEGWVGLSGGETGPQASELRRPPTDWKIESATGKDVPADGGQSTELHGPPTGFKVEGGRPTLQSSDPEEGGEVVTGESLRRPALGDDLFKVKMEDVLVSSPSVPAAPGGSPIPYPLAEETSGGGGAGAEAVMRLKGQENKIQEALGSSSSSSGAMASDDVPDGGGPGIADSIARKAGEGQKDFLKVSMKEAFISREAPTGIDGESTDKDHKGEIEVLARRTDVKDSHDRFSDTKPDAPPKPAAQLMEDDDDLESNTLLDLKPEPAVKEMLPGLAGQVSGDLDLDVDFDGDADGDTDESEL